MSDRADKLFDWIATQVAAAWTAEGEAIVSAKRADLGTPATVAVGPRGGRRVVGARRGESPRKRSGTLQAGVGSSVGRDGDNVVLTITDPVAYGVYLRDRGYVVLSDVPDRFGGRVADAAAVAVNGSS